MASRRLRVLFLASKPAGLSPSQRFRLEQWAPYLRRDHGIELVLAPFESAVLANILPKRGHFFRKAYEVLLGYARRLRTLRHLREFDAVVVHREAALIGPAILERLIASSGKPLIFDFDDAIWLTPPGSSLTAKLHFPGKTKSICKMATAVSAGNSYLADFARQENSNVSVVPTSIDLQDYRQVAEPTGDRFVVCWTGSTSTLRHFETARTALEQLARQVPLTVKVICNCPPDHPIEGAELEFVPWSAETEVAEIGRCHAGIMPLPDDDFARGKCGLKALQFMALGRPVVASPVGVNTKILRSGENGYVASDPEEFASFLLDLARSSPLRARLGQAGRQTVERHYSGEVVAKQFADIVRFAVEASGTLDSKLMSAPRVRGVAPDAVQ